MNENKKEEKTIKMEILKISTKHNVSQKTQRLFGHKLISLHRNYQYWIDRTIEIKMRIWSLRSKDLL